MFPLKYATAGQEVPLGQFVSPTDINSEQTGLSIANTDIKLWKNGATSVANKNSGGATHMSNGIYYATLDAIDTNVYGPMKIFVNKSGAVPVILECNVMEENAYDALMAELGTGYIEAQVNNLAVGTGGVSTTALSFTNTTGVIVSGTVDSTKARDGVFHQIADSGGTVDVYYEFDVGTVGVPQSVTHFGRSNGGNDDMNVFAWNWDTSAWEQIGEIPGQNGSTNLERTFPMYTTHVGGGENIGKVRVRFQNTGLTSSDLYNDQLFVTFTNQGSILGYAGGQIWMDTNNGVPGTVKDVNGVADLKSDNIADTLSLSSATSLNKIQVAQGSSFSIPSALTYKDFDGVDYVLAFNGQQLDNCVIKGAVLSGVCLGNGGSILLISCKFGTCTLPEVAVIDGAFGGDITANKAGEYVFERCFSVVAGTGTPSFDFGSSVGSINLSMRHYSGGIEIRNMGVTGTDTMSLEGNGQLKIAASCVSGTIAIRGNFTVTDSSGGVMTLSDGARYDIQQIRDALKLAPTSGTPDSGSVDEALDNIETSTAGLPPAYKKNVAFPRFMFFMADSSDTTVGKSGLTISGTISKDGGAFGALSGTVVELSNGWYYIDLTQTEMNADSIALRFTATGAVERNLAFATNS